MLFKSKTVIVITRRRNINTVVRYFLSYFYYKDNFLTYFVVLKKCLVKQLPTKLY